MVSPLQPTIAQIRRLLSRVFDDPSLDAFCQDYFPAVYDKFSRGLRKDEKITLLIDHCRRSADNFETLRQAAQQEYELSNGQRTELKSLAEMEFDSIAVPDDFLDSPHGQEQSIAQARRLLVNEVLANILSIDTRLEFVKTSLSRDKFSQKLDQVREKVAPALNQVAITGYRQLIAAQEVASLRQALNSRPLRLEFGPSLIQVLIESGGDPGPIRFFYDQLAQVQDASESLLNVLSTVATDNPNSEQSFIYYKKQVALAVDVLQNRSTIAYLAGLKILSGYENVVASNLTARLTNLKHLSPNHLIHETEITQHLGLCLREAKNLYLKRAELLTSSQQILEQKLEEYEAINNELVIGSDDPWNIVIAKAISLRQLGRTSESIAAFARYGEMFSTSDSTASRYSRIAQQFTLQLKKLKVEDGVYTFEVVEESAASHAGLSEGDIIEFAGQEIRNMDDLVSVLEKFGPESNIKLIYLRMKTDGSFSTDRTNISELPLGASLMPI